MTIAGSKCTIQPSPPAASKLNLSIAWDSANPPSHGDRVSYQCQADKWNRFLNDFSRDNVSVECLAENKWRNITWPVCVDGKYDGVLQARVLHQIFSVVDIECPDPASLNTEQIIFAGESTPTVRNYQDTVR